MFVPKIRHQMTDVFNAIDFYPIRSVPIKTSKAICVRTLQQQQQRSTKVLELVEYSGTAAVVDNHKQLTKRRRRRRRRWR